MINKLKDFFRKNFSVWHLIGMALCAFLAFLYWSKIGKDSEYLIKNNIYLVILWGLALGYVTVDMAFQASKRSKDDEQKKSED